MPECGFTWTTTSTTEKAGRVVTTHTCRKPAGHDSTMHACVNDAGTIHVVEFRLGARTGRLAA